MDILEVGLQMVGLYLRVGILDCAFQKPNHLQSKVLSTTQN